MLLENVKRQFENDSSAFDDDPDIFLLSFKAYRNVWPYSNAPVANRSHLQLTGHITWLLQYSTIYDGFPTIFKLPVIEVQMLNAKNGDTE